MKFTHTFVDKPCLNNIKVAACTTCIYENQYIKEWVDYNLNIGIDKIFIYDKNFDDNEHPETELHDLIDLGKVEIINWRDKSTCRQYESFNDCFINHKNEYDWICFFDIDEFITFNSNIKLTNIKDYLGLPIFADYDVIQINWLCYGDNNLINNEPDKGVLERFINPCQIDFKIWHKWTNSFQPYNMHCKCICRTDKNVIFTQDSHLPVKSENKELKYCTSYGCETTGEMTIVPLNEKTYTYAYLRHYTTKTIDEFLNKARGINPSLCKTKDKRDAIIETVIKSIFNTWIYVNPMNSADVSAGDKFKTTQKIKKISDFLLTL